MSRILNAQMHAGLQVFACAARHMSFTRCAEELHVTPGAISQQMRQLEEKLGFALFLRIGRGLELTAEGQRLAIVANEVHSRIDDELRLLHSGRIGGVFKLRCIPSFLQKWLLPRLPKLEQTFPDLQLRIIAEDSSGSLRDDDFDLAIDLNDGSYPGLLSTSLLEEQLFPVCSPRLLAGRVPLDTPEKLIHYPLLHDITAWRGSYEYAEWEFYLSAIGATGIDVRRGHTFNRNLLTIEAAILGMGVAIARKSLITDELKNGALVIPFGEEIPARKKYVIVYRDDALKNPARRAVHDWLVNQALSAKSVAIVRIDSS